jgi:hypothetical protein
MAPPHRQAMAIAVRSVSGPKRVVEAAGMAPPPTHLYQDRRGELSHTGKNFLLDRLVQSSGERREESHIDLRREHLID